MTIPSEVNRSGPYSCNGSTTSFAYGFKIFDEDHIRVIKTDANGAETTLTIGTHYTVSGVGSDGGGAVTTTTAYATGNEITLILNVPFTQEVDLENQGAYFAETIERSFDLQTQMSLQIKEKLNRAVVLPASETGNVTIPAETLNDMANGYALVTQYKNEAAASAAAAAESAAEAAAVVFDPTNYYAKTDFKADGSANAPVKHGSAGELLGKKLIVNEVLANQARVELWADGVVKWILLRDVDGKLQIYNAAGSVSTYSVDPTTNKVSFTALPLYGTRDIVALDTDGKLPALDGSKLTNVVGVLLQSKMVSYSGASTSLTSVIPLDSSAPQNTEGTQILSTSITPKSTTSKLRCKFTCSSVAMVGSGRAVAAMFVNSGNNAVQAASSYNTNSGSNSLSMDYEWVPGALTSQTISVRVGPTDGGTGIVINSANGVADLGGVMATTLTIEEVV